jgi:RNase H-like domain found in reverse transcriptase
LSSLTLSTATWDWTEQCQKAFEDMKKLIAKETFLTYPNFNKAFEIRIDASKVQLGACILPEGRPVAFYSRNLTLREFKNVKMSQALNSSAKNTYP